MTKIELYLSHIKNSDIIINHNIKCSMLNEMFCFNLNNHKPTSKNIENNKIKFFTFSDVLDNSASLDVSNFIINETKQNIATEFLMYVSNLKFGNNNFKTNIPNWEDIKTFIDVSCSEKYDDDVTEFKKTAGIISCDEKTNESGRKILGELFKLCPWRFNVNNKLSSFPFKKGDKIIYDYTIIAGPIKRIYTIQLNIV